ncbi:MAG: AAA family ATPase [Chloroflexi bacterium]|nr:AAA family ATPase [Chloroflexota bacterium]
MSSMGHSHNLPVQTIPFVGREAELVQLANLLADPNTRLVTVLGPGGMGKTRLALEAAVARQENFVHGAYFVSLAPLRDAENIVPTVAQAVGYLFQGDGRDPKEQLVDYLSQKRALLIMDNFEHLIEGAGLVSEILQTAPGVRVLATAREPLNLQEEIHFRIGGLNFPAKETLKDAASWTEYSAMRLFVLSARRVLPGFTPESGDLRHVVRICQLVDGMPLGIVLAAAWAEMLSLQEIADEINHSLDVLETEARNVPARHRSVRAMFDATWNRLADTERQILMQLSVFRGGFTRDAAQRVTGAGLRTLKTLVNKSLLRRDHDTGRYEVHELLRQYAEERLKSSGNAVAARDTHCEYYLVALHQHEADLDRRQRSAAFTDEVTQPLVDPLTKRELEVLHLIAAGLSNREIAERLFVGLSTVKKHINRMYGKLGVKRRTQAIVRARELSLLQKD